MLIFLPLVKKDGSILFIASCQVFLKETEDKVTRRKAAALRLELAFGHNSLLLFSTFSPMTIHSSCRHIEKKQNIQYIQYL